MSHELEGQLGQSAAALVSKMSRRCKAKPRASARDLFIRDLFIGGKFEKDLWKNLKKRYCF